MNKYLLIILSSFLLSSCSKKVRFFDAQKLHVEKTESKKNEDFVKVEAYFAGDALDYVVFELDVFNNSSDTLLFDFRDVYLKVYDKNLSSPIILNALNKEDVIYNLEKNSLEIDQEKRGRDFGNAVSIGLNILSIGSGNGYSALDAMIYSTETAAFMMEDSRAHKLLKGSLEEQIKYVDEWVIYKEILLPNQDESWDVLFERKLFESEADFVLEIHGKEYSVPFNLNVIEERVR